MSNRYSCNDDIDELFIHKSLSRFERELARLRQSGSLASLLDIQAILKAPGSSRVIALRGPDFGDDNAEYSVSVISEEHEKVIAGATVPSSWLMPHLAIDTVALVIRFAPGREPRQVDQLTALPHGDWLVSGGSLSSVFNIVRTLLLPVQDKPFKGFLNRVRSRHFLDCKG